MTAPLSQSTASLFAAYRGGAGVFDELVAPAGAQRPHWQTFTRLIDQLGVPELERRRELARRMIRDHGVTYNVYGDPQGMDRPWEFDMVPLLIPAADWRGIESALIQRARLFNLILADLYGPQRLLHDGALPPALVFANPGFLRPCHGLAAPGNLYLHLHAVDLARSPDGQWWVLADRAQAPSGTGYALENRIVATRGLDDVMRACQIQRLAPFFQAHRERLADLARARNPRIVLLTPGPHNETYFEHAYLSRYLGFDLVEGADLTVRDDQVFVKTLAGLQRVDVILRRVDDLFCDPLELRSDSFLGVAGLLQAARAGRVVIANALGAGAIETPALLAFLPGLCERLLGEPLRMPSVATWWCGQPRALDHVLAHLDQLLIKPAFPAVRGGAPVFPERLDAGQHADLIAAIRAQPAEFVGQERVALATAPAWQAAEPQPRAVALRAFVGAAGETFAVMPGGLTRVAGAADPLVVSMQSGGGSKDTWILADGPVSSLSLLQPPTQSVELVRAAADLPSRAADNLFWLGRYAERAEQTARLLRALLTRMSSEAAPDQTAELVAVARVLWGLALFQTRCDDVPCHDALAEEVRATILIEQRAGSLRAVLNRLRRAASAVRNHLSADTWRILALPRQELVRAGELGATAALALLERLIVEWAAFSGMEAENMTRGHAWRFLEIGRRIERGLASLNLLRVALLHAPADGGPLLGPLLEIADTTMTYRRRYFIRPQLAPALDLLIADENNPRAVAYQVRALATQVRQLPALAGGQPHHRAQELASRLLLRSVQTDLLAVCRAREQGDPAPLDAWLQSLDGDVRALADMIIHTYFSHAGPTMSAT